MACRQLPGRAPEFRRYGTLLALSWSETIHRIALATGLIPMPARAADMAKTIHVAFGTAENGFDPQAVYAPTSKT